MRKALLAMWPRVLWQRYLLLLLLSLGLFWLLVPSLRFPEWGATVVEDRDGRLLGARVAADGQWRFPGRAAVPEKFEKALLQYEDRWFWYHPGINPLALAGALRHNWQQKGNRRGGSTLTMQLARLSRPPAARRMGVKLLEMAMAIKAEMRYSKRTLLELYAAHAPFGGNVVGLEAASWRYFNQPPAQLTWAEAAALAVLPNSPALVFPGKNESTFLRKRNRLLRRLRDVGEISESTYQLSISEPLPGKPRPLPALAGPFMNRLAGQGGLGKRMRTTLNTALQAQLQSMANRYASRLAFNEVFHLAAVVVEVKSGEVLAYVHASSSPDGAGAEVDIAHAPRSYGSLLKPFLYAAMLTEGSLLPRQWVDDRPVYYDGYMPQNFLKEFDGLVPANEVLSRSLNVPSVNLLRQYGTARFLHQLRQSGLSGFGKPASHYGLSLILGGSEARLWELTGLYAALANRLATAAEQYPVRWLKEGEKGQKTFNTRAFSRASLWFTFQALTENVRPITQTNWEYFPSARRIAWKTGTSFGQRDAWAIGLNADYVVGVWVGNASGEGRPGLTGVQVAAPIMFDMLYALPAGGWFKMPQNEMQERPCCAVTGMPAGPDCGEIRRMLLPPDRGLVLPCTYHKALWLDSSTSHRVDAACYPLDAAKKQVFLVLPPAAAYYYRRKHPAWQAPPPWRDGCSSKGSSTAGQLQLVYPAPNAVLYLPLVRDSVRANLILEAAHQQPAQVLYWHLNQEYIGQTTDFHQMKVQLAPGKYQLSVVDEQGNAVSRNFQVVR